MWDLYLTQRVLLECGHELDFDYESTLRGTGLNGDVTVTEGMGGCMRWPGGFGPVQGFWHSLSVCAPCGDDP